MTKVEELIQRMLAFNTEGSMPFDGYPGMSDLDVSLVHEAVAETRSDTCVQFSCPIITISYLAGEHAKTRQQYDSCRAYLDEYVENVWVCNMEEGRNAVHESIFNANVAA